MKTVPLKILLIEDSPADAALLEALLQRVTEFAFEMDHAAVLAAGVKKLGESSYDAVMLDLSLPDSDGLKSYELIRVHAQDIPIIILTGNHDRDVMANAMHKGADNYLIKDAFDGNRIAIAILSAIRNRSKTLQ